jgi:ApeA N-terminal domain 1
MKARSHAGRWWLPGTSREVPGTLTFTANTGIQLDLIGSLEASDEETPPKPPLLRDYPLILGRADGAGEVTLENCHQTSLGVGNTVTQTIYADRLYDGVQFSDPSDATFSGASISFERLTDWVGQSGFLGRGDFPDIKNDVDTLIAFKSPPPLEVTLPGAKATIWTGGSSHLGWYEESVTQRTSLMFEAPVPLHFEVWRDAYFGRLHDLLDFATDRPCAIREVRLFDTDGDISERRRVEVAHRLIESAPDDLKRPLLPNEILFTLSSALKLVPDVIEVWFELREKLAYAGDLLFSTLYREQMILDNYFWNVAQAAEIAHREVFGLDASGNTRDIYFIKRMKELVASTNGTVAGVVPDPAGFATRVRDTRNYITHGNPRQQKSSVRDADLYYLAHQLGFVLKANILLKLGFPDAEVGLILGRNSRFALIRHLISTGKIQP